MIFSGTKNASAHWLNRRCLLEVEEIAVRRRVKAIALATEKTGFSPFLPLAAGMLIALFAVSLAMAEPHSTSAVVATHETTETTGLGVEGGLDSDALPADSEISSRPLPPPRYPDRYEFYHRYDRGLSSRNSPNDDGLQ
jgi:hypothetical protein